MKRLSVFTLLVVASLLLSAAFLPSFGVAAQTGGSTTSTPSAGGTSTSNSNSTNNGSTSSNGTTTAANAAFIRFRQFQNFKVVDLSGNTIGSVSDFVVNVPKQRIDYIVSTLSNGGRTVLVPWSSLAAVDAANDTFVYYSDPARLQNSPAFSASNFNFNDPNWSQSIVSYWRSGVVRNGVTVTGGSSSSASGTPSANSSASTTGTPEATAAAGTNSTAMASATSMPSTSSSNTVASNACVPNTGSSSSSSSSSSSASTTGTPAATAAAGTSSSASSNVNCVNRGFGPIAILASQLLNAPVYSEETVNSAGQVIGNNAVFVQRSSGIPATGGTAVATGSVVGATPMATTAATGSVPNTGSSDLSAQQIGTVQGMIVTRINGHIDFLLVSPNGAVLNTGNYRNGSLNVPSSNVVSTPVATAAASTSNSTVSTSTPVATTAAGASSTLASTPMATTAAGTSSTAASTPMATTAAGTSSSTVSTPVATTMANTANVPNTGANKYANGVLVPVPFGSVFRSVSTNNQVLLRVSPVALANAPVVPADLNPYLGFGWDTAVWSFWTNTRNLFSSNAILNTGGNGSSSSSATGTPSP